MKKFLFPFVPIKYCRPVKLSIQSLFSTEIWNLTSTVCFFSLIFRNRAAVSLFLDLWATQRHPSDHNIGSKWHLGQKYFLARLKISLKGGKEKEDTEDLRIWVWYSGCPEMDSCFNPPLLTPNHLKFYPSRLSKWRNLRKCLLEKLLALKNETKGWNHSRDIL